MIKKYLLYYFYKLLNIVLKMSKYHFIAIGGAVMHQLALHLKQEGHEISGSDDAIFEPAKSNLEKAGILPENIGWNDTVITPDIDAIILGMHAKADNPELLKAQDLNLKIYSFPEFFYEQCKAKVRIAVAGSHGKTSITSMLMHLFKNHDAKFDYLVGAKLDGFQYMVNSASNNEYAIIEADEYLTSPLDLRSKFLHYYPNIAIISGIAWDHINVFPAYDSYLETFRKFIQSIKKDGYLIYNNNDDELVNLIKSIDTTHVQLIPYCSLASEVIDENVYIKYNDKSYKINVFGTHNLSNLNAAFEVGKIVGFSEESILKSFETFSGAAKRLENVFDDKERRISIYRDFAHAPSKVIATVNAVREKYQNRKIIAFLELHTYSSLQENFIEQYANSLAKADVKFLYIDEEALKIKNKEKFDAQWLKKQFNDETIIVVEDKNDILELIKNELENNSVLLLMSSGNLGGLDIQQLMD